MTAAVISHLERLAQPLAASSARQGAALSSADAPKATPKKGESRALKLILTKIQGPEAALETSPVYRWQESNRKSSVHPIMNKN